MKIKQRPSKRKFFLTFDFYVQDLQIKVYIYYTYMKTTDENIITRISSLSHKTNSKSQYVVNFTFKLLSRLIFGWNTRFCQPLEYLKKISIKLSHLFSKNEKKLTKTDQSVTLSCFQIVSFSNTVFWSSSDLRTRKLTRVNIKRLSQ